MLRIDNLSISLEPFRVLLNTTVYKIYWNHDASKKSHGKEKMKFCSQGTDTCQNTRILTLNTLVVIKGKGKCLAYQMIHDLLNTNDMQPPFHQKRIKIK